MSDTIVDLIDFSKFVNCEIILSLYRRQNYSNTVLLTRELHRFHPNGRCAATVASFSVEVSRKSNQRSRLPALHGTEASMTPHRRSIMDVVFSKAQELTSVAQPGRTLTVELHRTPVLMTFGVAG